MLGKVTQRSFHLVVFFAQFHQGWWCSEITLMVGGQEKEGANLFPGFLCMHTSWKSSCFGGRVGFMVVPGRRRLLAGGTDKPGAAWLEQAGLTGSSHRCRADSLSHDVTRRHMFPFVDQIKLSNLMTSFLFYF